MDITYRTDYGFLEVAPTGKLTRDDFQHLSKEIDHILHSRRALKGVLIYTKDFPGYEAFSDLIAHGEFVKEHHDKIRKVAVCTDSSAAGLLKAIGAVYAEAEVEKFSFDDKDEAEKWLLS